MSRSAPFLGYWTYRKCVQLGSFHMTFAVIGIHFLASRGPPTNLSEHRSLEDCTDKERLLFSLGGKFQVASAPHSADRNIRFPFALSKPRPSSVVRKLTVRCPRRPAGYLSFFKNPSSSTAFTILESTMVETSILANSGRVRAISATIVFMPSSVGYGRSGIAPFM